MHLLVQCSYLLQLLVHSWWGRLSLNDTHLQKQWYRQYCDGFDQRKQTEGVIAPVKTVRSIPLTNECECDDENMDHSSGAVALSSTDCSSVIFLLTVGGRLRIKQFVRFVFVFTVLRPEDRSCETLMLPILLLCIFMFLVSSLLQMKSSGWIFVSAQCSEESRWGGGLEFDVYDARPQTLLDLKGSGRVTVTLESQCMDIFWQSKGFKEKEFNKWPHQVHDAHATFAHTIHIILVTSSFDNSPNVNKEMFNKLMRSLMLRLYNIHFWRQLCNQVILLLQRLISAVSWIIMGP